MINILHARIALFGSILLVLLGLSSAPAAAQSTGFYIGGGAGVSSVDVCGDLNALGASSCDDRDTGFKIFGGYGINQNLAVEIGYIDLGEIEASGGGATIKAETDGVEAAAVGILPINRQFSVFGKLGLFMWDVSVSGSGPGGSASISDDGTDLMFGLGGSWNLTPQLSLRAEWERFDVDEDADFFSASVVYRF